jgi:hypothetical protein
MYRPSASPEACPGRPSCFPVRKSFVRSDHRIRKSAAGNGSSDHRFCRTSTGLQPLYRHLPPAANHHRPCVQLSIKQEFINLMDERMEEQDNVYFYELANYK